MKVSKQLLEFIEQKRNPREPLGETLWRLLHERDFLRKKVEGLELEVQDLKEALDLERVVKEVRNKDMVVTPIVR
jgi:hypothetical protein